MRGLGVSVGKWSVVMGSRVHSEVRVVMMHVGVCFICISRLMTGFFPV